MKYPISVTPELINTLEEACRYGNFLMEELLDIIHCEGLTELHAEELDGDLREMLEDILGG